MAKYVYPAILTVEETGYSVNFPDLPNCFTQGEDIADALEMANDVLCLTLYDMEIKKHEIPIPSNVQILAMKYPNDTISLVVCDTVEYRKYNDNKAVKKTLTIPSWLNTIAEEQGINFSATLQYALKEQLHIQ